MNSETKLQASRFLASLIRHTSISPDYVSFDLAPRSTMVLALATVLGSLISDLSMVAEDAMQKEHLLEEWTSDTLTENGFEQVTAIRRHVAGVFGPEGAVRKAADRFMLANPH